MIERYLTQIASVTKRGDAREESYYSALASFLEEFSESHRKKKVHVTILPKKTEAGNPDMRVWDGKHSQVGYVEVKPPHAKLDDIQETEQLERYLATFPNLILTNLYEFRLYRNGKLVTSVLVARPFIAAKLKTVPPAEHKEEFLALLETFFQFSLPEKFTAETLATELASRTRFLRDQVIKEELREAKSAGGRKILGFFEAFQKHLIANLKPDEFADIYAQTITYGLFAARTRSNGKFDRRIAYDLIPKTIGILREIFQFTSFDPPEQLQVTVDDIAEVLAVADVKGILHDYFEKGKGSDPIYHFYETFLAAYDPAQRERRGVYYTPEPVVSYIVRSLNIILKEKFGREDGFATPSVTVLDPAAGTLTFLAEAAKLAVEEYVSKYGEGSRQKFIEDHILKHFYAFELMMAPYAAGHLKMSYLMEELGHKLSGAERFQFYLTNTLEMEDLAQTSLPGMSSLSEESHLAGKVKKEQPILVILGNPPYSGHSVNKGDWITQQIENYKQVDGKPLGEKNPKWLQDDYVKFIRFAQWKIDQAGEGILGFITNHSYLDNPTFRGMRQSLMNSFDEIHILDLHGNSLKKEKAPDGSKDGNVFDIQQGVAIGLFVRKKNFKGEKKTVHAELWGLREKKYNRLLKSDVKVTKWGNLNPSSPFYLFVPRDEKRSAVFQSYPSIPEIFPVNSVGIVTARDHFVIDFDKRTLERRIGQFRDDSLDDMIISKAYDLKDSGAWKLKKARKELYKEDNWKDYFVRLLYRPFDTRELFYHDAVIERSRKEVMRHMLQENIGLVVPRQVLREFRHTYVSNRITNFNLIDTAGRFGSGFLFPLYLYQERHPGGATGGGKASFYQAALLFEPSASYTPPKANLNQLLVNKLSESYKKEPTPEEIFYYIYALLYSNAYRKKYAEFLRADFPRVPFTASEKIFRALAQKGEELVGLHLLKSKKLTKPIGMFEGKGDNRVQKVAYDEKHKRVYINTSQYFEGVNAEVWVYHVGGYQVAEKWLKDRKGRVLSSEEVSHYCKVISALSETIKIQATLDELFEEVEKKIMDINQ